MTIAPTKLFSLSIGTEACVAPSPAVGFHHVAACRPRAVHDDAQSYQNVRFSGTWFDGIGLFGFDAERQAFIAIDVSLPLLGVRSWSDDTTWPGTQFWGKAAIWNKFPRTHVSLDDVIRLRLREMKPSFAANVRRWAKEDRDYATEFQARVKRVLEDQNV